MAGLRETTVGRAVLVAAVLALGWAAWNLTLRPYPSDFCSSPLSEFSESTDDEMQARTRPRSEEPFGRILSSQEREARRLAALCPDPSTEAGFWFRGLAPLVVVVGGGLAVRYIATGSVRQGFPQDPA